MFIQVIQGKVKDEPGLRRCMDTWQRDLAPGATGYLGTTAGMCDDGTFIALARFESSEAAARNSARPEQGAWWKQTEACFDGPGDLPRLRRRAALARTAATDQAGFVQIMEGRSTDVRRMHEIMDEVGERMRQARPEIIGAMLADASETAVTSRPSTSPREAEARDHEKMDVPDDLRSLIEEENRLMGDVSYFDLREPMLAARRNQLGRNPTRPHTSQRPPDRSRRKRQRLRVDVPAGQLDAFLHRRRCAAVFERHRQPAEREADPGVAAGARGRAARDRRTCRTRCPQRPSRRRR